jgi:cardiolipin synthase
VLTLPNLISLVRLACVPVFLWLLFGRDDRLGAALLLAVLGTTDWVDGWIARRYHQVSTVGKILDPTADRVLLVVAVVAILVDGSVPAVVAWLAIARELTVSTGVLVLAALGARRIDVSWAGKCGTFGLMMAFPLFLISRAPDFSLGDEARVLAWVCAVVGLSFSYWSAFGYVPQGRDALRGRGGGRERREGREAAPGGRIGSAR